MKQNIDTIDQIMNSMTFPVIIIDLENKISIINIAGENFLKSSSKMIIGNTIENYLPFSSPLLDLIKKCKKEGVGFNEYGLDLSNPRIGIKKDVDAQVTSLPDGSLMIILLITVSKEIFLREVTLIKLVIHYHILLQCYLTKLKILYQGSEGPLN